MESATPRRFGDDLHPIRADIERLLSQAAAGNLSRVAYFLMCARAVADQEIRQAAEDADGVSTCQLSRLLN